MFDIFCPPGQTFQGAGCADRPTATKEAISGMERDCKFKAQTATATALRADGTTTSLVEIADTFQCQKCPDMQVCYEGTAGTSKWCWGKEEAPITDWADPKYDEWNMHEWRLPDYEAVECQDCDSDIFTEALCTFEANYFNAQEGLRVNCPFQSEIRDVVRFKNSHRAEYSDYQSKSHFLADYQYPYCKTDFDYFTPF